MPAPQASQMQQYARATFTNFKIKVPTNWQDPQGDPAADHYSKAFKTEEKSTSPGSPPLFLPATMNKYHTDTQKMHIDKYGKFIDGMCSAICSAWSQWQTATQMVGIVINATMATGGQLVGPPLMPLIMASAPKNGPQELKYSTAIANVISTSWLTFTATVKIVPPQAWYPSYAAVPMPMAIPVANVPGKFSSLMQVPTSISKDVMKPQMIGALADTNAPYHPQLFEAISDAFEKCYNDWKNVTMVNNVMPLVAPVPTYAPPYVPVGPVVGGTAMMLPGGLT